MLHLLCFAPAWCYNSLFLKGWVPGETVQKWERCIQKRKRAPFMNLLFGRKLLTGCRVKEKSKRLEQVRRSSWDLFMALPLTWQLLFKPYISFPAVKPGFLLQRAPVKPYLISTYGSTFKTSAETWYRLELWGGGVVCVCGTERTAAFAVSKKALGLFWGFAQQSCN